MGFDWKAVKSLFVETEDGNTKTPSKTEKKVESQKEASIIPPQTIPVDISAGKPDQAIINTLSNALSEANLEGFDYFEFAKIIENMMTSIPSEQMRYQAAFATAAAMNAHKQHLLDSADHYLAVLNNEAEKFLALVADQTKNTVTEKEDSIITIDTTIKEKADLITKLTLEINQLTSTKTAILNEASENRINIQKIQNDFAACLKVFQDKIAGDKAKIEQYIQG